MTIFRFFSLTLLIALCSFAAFSQDAPAVPKIVSGGVVNGKATNLVKPAYPPAAKAVNASGAVNVQVTIGEDGSVIAATAVSGHPLLRAAAVEAATASKFAPTVLSGQPVKITGIIVYNFVGAEPAKRDPSWLDLGMSLASIAEPTTTTSSGLASHLQNVPADWNDVRAMLTQLEELRGRAAADGQYPRSSADAIAKANEISRLVELKLEDTRTEIWRFRLGRALFNAFASASSKSDEKRRQAAFALRELAFVTPPGVEVKTVDELTVLSDLVEKGNLSDAELKQFDELHSKMQNLFR